MMTLVQIKVSNTDMLITGWQGAYELPATFISPPHSPIVRKWIIPVEYYS
jgi:hypothetical protein